MQYPSFCSTSKHPAQALNKLEKNVKKLQLGRKCRSFGENFKLQMWMQWSTSSEEITEDFLPVWMTEKLSI